ncbi:VanZ family protein [Butyricicoccus sp.]|uniref:VanZ family protein n=1 Tax=Butyricicoccus sp. TaxID=2049021 RepID=UPI003D7E0AB2
MIDMIFSLCSYYFIGLPIYLFCGWLLYRRYRKRQSCSKGFFVGWQIFALLLSMMFSVTGTGGIDNVVYNMQTSGHLIQSFDLNVIPFTNTDLTGLVLNIILFVPFGIMLPILWRPCSGIFVVQTGFFLSAAIELSQLFNMRSTDINDLITNTLGACLGYVIYKQIFHRITWFQADDPHNKQTISCCIILIVAVYMCIASPISNPI